MHFVFRYVIVSMVIEMNTGRKHFPGINISRGLDPAHAHETFSIHTHQNAELFLFVSGKGTYHVEGSEYPLSPGDIMLMRPTEAHFIETDPNYDYDRIILSFDPGILIGLDPDNGLMRPLFDRKSGKRNHYSAADFPNDLYRTYIDRMLTADCDRLTSLACLILLMKELQALFDRGESESQPDTPEYRIIRYINKNLDKELSLTELCDKFFLSRAQLCLRFKNATGISVGKYISSKRLIRAQQMILEGKRPTDIYFACGYQDYSTFYRAYSRFFGHSPKQESGEINERIDLT